MQSLSNGSKLGSYTIVRLVGRGGMGEVYEAYEHRLRRRVALKVIAPQNSGQHGEGDLVRRFLSEARTLAQINHPNVVTIYSIDRVGDTQFIAMEYVDGFPLKKLTQSVAIGADEAAPIFLQMLEGLKALHNAHILHRDLKPNNLMVRPDGQLKLLDFGIAKRINDENRDTTTAGVIVGTLAYLPPEVLYGTPANERSDLWSLGAIFYECMVGRPLVTTRGKKIKGKRAFENSDVVFPEETLGWIPHSMRTIIGRMCDSQPEERYTDVAKAIDAIRYYQSNRPLLPPSFQPQFLNLLAKVPDMKAPENPEEQKPSAEKRKVAISLYAGARPTEAATEQAQVAGARIQEPITDREVSEVVMDSISARRRMRAGMKRKRFLGPAQFAAAVTGILLLISYGINHFRPNRTQSLAPVAPVAEGPIELKAPNDQATVWVAPGQSPVLSWSKILSGREYELQIATDADFHSIVGREHVSGSFYHPPRPLPEGEFYWRLYPLQDQLFAPSAARFSVSYLSPVEPTTPESAAKFTLTGDQPFQNIDFSWKCKTNARGYHIQISGDAKFASISNDQILPVCEWRNVQLPVGSYFWRVRIEDASISTAEWSAVRNFTIGSTAVNNLAEAAPPPAAAPEPRKVRAFTLLHPHILKTSQRIILKFAETQGRTPASTAQILNPPTVAWSPIRDAKEYKLQLSTTANFSSLLAEETVNTTHFEWRPSTIIGKVYWRVRAYNLAMDASQYSERGFLELHVPAPKLQSAYKLTMDREIAWSPVPLTGRYVVQTSDDPRMGIVTEQVTGKPGLALNNVKSKAVFVRVAALGPTGDRVSDFSDVSKVTAPANIPEIISPSNGVRVIVGASGRITVNFSWKGVPQASDYLIEIAGDSDFTNVIRHQMVKPTRYILKGAKLNGRVYWRVRTDGKGGASEWSAPGTFEVTNSKIANDD